jgi:hypothetical protein
MSNDSTGTPRLIANSLFPLLPLVAAMSPARSTCVHPICRVPLLAQDSACAHSGHSSTSSCSVRSGRVDAIPYSSQAWPDCTSCVLWRRGRRSFCWRWDCRRLHRHLFQGKSLQRREQSCRFYLHSISLWSELNKSSAHHAMLMGWCVSTF